MEEVKKKVLSVRPPIVSVLGHVDHGKTTLLDFIRSTHVQKKEAGGITQGIGASVAEVKSGQRITFIDTPGHSAFSAMRSRGVNACDIAILVIAANDGIKPQTKEALDFIRDAKVPFIVAITKSDLPSIDISMVKNQLLKEGVMIEEAGGDVPVLEVSGKTGKGVPELLDMILLVSELNNILGDATDPLSAVVIETNKDNRGLLVSAVVKSGSIEVGSEVASNGITSKVRGLFDSYGKSVKKVLPGEPVQIIGFTSLPRVGSLISVSQIGDNLEKEAEKTNVSKIKEGQLGVFIKAGTAGKLEAILANIPKEVVVVYSGVGEINENDVFLAKSGGIKIFTFELKTPPNVVRLASTESVNVENFDIIYKLFEKLEKLLKGEEIDVSGKAIIQAIFPFNNKKIAGSKMILGTIKKTDKLVVMRGNKEIGKTKLQSLKKEKRDVTEVSVGEEFGALFDPYVPFEPGDELLSVR